VTRAFIVKDEAIDALGNASRKVAELIRNIKDPSASAVGAWSAGDVAAHLIDAAEDNRKAARGEGTPYRSPGDVAPTNDARLAARAERDPKALASAYEEAIIAYLEELKGIEGDPVIPWADFQIPLSTLVAADIGECLVHGYDIATSQNRPWKIDRHAAALSGRGLAPMTEHYVDERAAAGFSGIFDVRLRGQPPLYFVFTDGSLAVEDAGVRRPDVHISADPAAFMLVAYGRISQWGPIARGQLLAWGRKPWLAMKFATFMKNP